MITLGINAAFHDSAAALLIDGVLQSAAEEERFTRIKHAKRPLPFTAWELPFHAIDYCLAEAGLHLRDVDHVAYSFDAAAFAEGRFDLQAASIPLPLRPPTPEEGEGHSPWDPLFLSYMVNAPRQLTDGAPHHLRRRLHGLQPGEGFQWHAVDHHLAHQASAFLAAPFQRCAVLTLDGRGERATTTYGVYRDHTYQPLGAVHMPHSLGIFFEELTTYLGFLHSSDEYKVMALAALGTLRFRPAMRDAIRFQKDGQYTIDAVDWVGLCGPAREPGAPMEAHHLDAAASAQDVLEEAALRLTRWLQERTGESNLAMAGGVALNCVMNARLRDGGPFDQVWIQPAAGDAGTALGAALWVDAAQRLQPVAPQTAPGTRAAVQRHAPPERAVPLAPRRWTMAHAYWGPSFTDAEIERQLLDAKLPFRRLEDVAETTADLLAQDCVIGWFQGRMEFGPRALGARSILASPLNPAMQMRLNALKDREDFRPVAPVVPTELLADWFTPAKANGGESPFMLFTYEALLGQAERIPSACHTDRSARVQTVSEHSHPLFHALLHAFKRRTGVPVIINTSYNVRGQPVVCDVKAALEAFFTTPLDALVIGSYLITKRS
ncbi:MAG: carbamoyltransferase C-terminal domain-containing protein [Pseudomonadota bacterium]